MNYKQFITEELTRRQSRNSRYSLRSFAKSLGVSATTLSEVLNGKRDLRRDSIEKIADKLGLEPDQRSHFTLSALGVPLDEKPKKGVSQATYDQFDVDRFKAVSDWYHFAILSLAKLKTNEADSVWISQRLAISRSEAKDAFERLCRLELIQVTGKRFRRTTNPLFVNSAAPSSAIRKYHRQNLEKALDSLERDPIDVRDFSSITMAINPARMESGRRLIRNFREKFAETMEADEPTEIYTLAVQFFPISKPEHGERERS